MVSDEKIFSFHLENLDLDMQRTGTIRIIIEEGHIMTIPAKFGQNPASHLGDVFETIVDHGRVTSNDHNSSP